MENPLLQWCVVLPRHIEGDEYDDIYRVAPRALDALGMVTGITHMEWFRRPDGSLAISEVAARPPGAQFTSLLSFAHDLDFYAAWARLVIHEEFTPPERNWAVGAVFLRGHGSGEVKRVTRHRGGPARAGRPGGPGAHPAHRHAQGGRLRRRGFCHPAPPRDRARRGRPPAHPRTGLDRAGLRRPAPLTPIRSPPMNILLIAPGFLAEMPLFTRGLAEIGARVLGVGDGPVQGLPEIARQCLSEYLSVRSLFDEQTTVAAIRNWAADESIDRVECLWEPGVVLAARVREALGVPGKSVEQAITFRDKETMKQVLDRAGVRTPRHARATTTQQVHEAAEHIGYPLIIKPIAGAGSADTYPVHDASELEEALRLTKHVPEVSVEEYIEGEELTYDTVCAGGDVLLPQRGLVPSQAARRAPQPLHLLAVHLPARHHGARHHEGSRAGHGGAPRPGIRDRLHPHGVVPDPQRRGGLR